MQAVILAGGKGTRLQPLTRTMPKPMVRLFNKPVLEHTIDLLKRHDIRDIVITVAYKAEHIIDYFGSGAKFGVNIEYSLEDMPRGTAGGLRKIKPLLKDTFLVISGDAVTDFDLTSAVEYHRRKSAIATILTHEVDDPGQFGIVDSTAEGKIRRFQEKPKLSEAFSNKVNTGVYILEPEIISYIPYDAVYDFSRNVFPALLQNQEDFFSCRAEGYWCDMGNLAQYRSVHFDALTGKVNLDLPAAHVMDGIWIGEDADIHPTVKLMAPLYVGSGVRVHRRSALGRFAIIGDGSTIDEEAHVTHSVTGRGTYVGKDAGVYGSVIGPGYSLTSGRKLTDEVVVHDADNELRAEIDFQLLSRCVVEEPMLTWSALETTRLLNELSQPHALAA